MTNHFEKHVVILFLCFFYFVYEHQQRKTETFVMNDIFYDPLNHEIHGFAWFVVMVKVFDREWKPNTSDYHWYNAELDVLLLIHIPCSLKQSDDFFPTLQNLQKN